jgi:hypothetical protein
MPRFKSIGFIPAATSPIIHQTKSCKIRRGNRDSFITFRCSISSLICFHVYIRWGNCGMKLKFQQVIREFLIRLSAFVISLSLLVACVNQPIAMTPQLMQQIDRLETVLFVEQDNIKIEVSDTNGGATGLLGFVIGAAIDSARRGNSEKNSVGLVDSLRSFQFRERMHEQLNAELNRVKAIQLLRPSQLQTTDTEALRLIALQRSSASALQFVNVTYRLLNSSLVMTADVQMYPKSQRLMSLRQKPNSQSLLDEGNLILRKNFFFVSEMIGVDVIQNSLKQGISNLAWQIALELERLQADTTMTTALAPVTIGAGNLAVTNPSLPALSPGAAGTDNLDVTLFGMWRGKLECGAYFGRGQVSNPRPWTVQVEMVIDNKSVTILKC